MRYTDAQIKAIEHGRAPAIVSAGAGSGKTAVLTQRVVRMVCDKNENIDPAKIAVVTFTDKAAGELKTRLDALMRQRIAQAADENEVKFLRRQRMSLRKARISTISSFCFSLLRENIDLAENVSAGFSVIDETRSAALKNEVLDDMLEKFYADGDDKYRSPVIENYIQKDDSLLRSLILSIHAKAINHTDPAAWLDKSDSSETAEEIRRSLKSAARCMYNDFAALLKELDNAVACYDGTEKDLYKAVKKHEEYAQAIKESYGKAAHALEQNGFCINDEVNGYLEHIPGRAPNDKSSDQSVKEYRNRAKELFGYLMKTCGKITSFDDDMKKSMPAVTGLKKLVLMFDEAYRAEKLSRNCADFSDAEREMYGMLCKHPEVRERTHLQLIIVDEFQDSNELQYLIFEKLSDEKRGLYFVGDIKQSIYGFRGAQPEVFLRLCKSDDFEQLPLNDNFRSQRCVIDGINTLFDRMMTTENGDVDYEKEGRLICGLDKDTDTPVAEKDKTEICVVTAEDRKAASRTEAAYIAARIKRMISDGYRVGSDQHPCTEDDFAIIMRSPKNKVDDYADVLRSNGLNVSYTQKSVLLERQEIRTMLSLLKVINDPYNDTELAKVLMSSLYCFTADDMARLRTGTFGFDIAAINKICPDELEHYSVGTKERIGMRKKSLYSCLMQAADGYDTSDYPKLHSLTLDVKPDEKCREFADDLDRFRNAAASSSPQELIRSIYDSISADELLSVGEDPAAKQANLELLVSYAREYSDYKDGGTLGDLIFNIENMSGLMAAQTAGGHGVKIMSVHTSKGLQFPVVFVSSCASRFNDDDYTGDIVVSEKYALASKSVDVSTMSKIQSPAYHASAENVRKQLSSEEMRLLYVAATRAENKLIFTANISKSGEEFMQSLDINRAGKQKCRCSSSNYLSWLLEVLSCESKKCLVNNQDGVIDYDDVRYIFYPFAYTKKSDDKAAALGCLEINTGDKTAESVQCGDNSVSETAVTDEEYKDEIEEKLKYVYAYEPLTKISAKFTATELAANLRKKMGEETHGLFVARPEFLTENQKGRLSGKRRGDAYHKLMEHIPFDKILTEAEIKSFTESCTSDYLDDSERSSIDPADIAKFFAHGEAKRIIAANNNGKLFREYPIFHKIDVDKYDPAIFGADSIDRLDGAEPYVQGIADMFFVEDDGIVLVDYKSDRTDDEDKYKDDYKLQLDIYKEALEKEFSMPVKQMMIYSFTLGKFIDLENPEDNK